MQQFHSWNAQLSYLAKTFMNKTATFTLHYQSVRSTELKKACSKMAPATTKESPVTDQDVETVISNTMGPDWKILGFVTEPFSKIKNGCLGTHIALKVTIQSKVEEDHGIVKTKKYFVKTAPDSPLIKDALMDDSMLFEEVNFYSKIYPLMIENYTGVQWSPRNYLATNDVLIFEDLQVQGYNLRDSSYLNELSLRLALAALARFHAASFIMEAKLGTKLNEAFPKAFVEKMYCKSSKFGRGTLIGYETIGLIAEKFGLDATCVPKIYDRVYKSVRARPGECNVVCHGDLWKNNLMFNDSEQKCILVDFQLLRYASLAIDIGMLLCLHTSPEDRKKWESGLLEHYYSVLYDTLSESTNTSVEIPTYASVLKDYNNHKLVGMTYAAIYAPGIHLDPDDLAFIMNDPINLEKWFLKERIGFITAGINKNPTYGNLLKDIITELLEEAKQVFS